MKQNKIKKIISVLDKINPNLETDAGEWVLNWKKIKRYIGNLEIAAMNDKYNYMGAKTDSDYFEYELVPFLKEKINLYEDVLSRIQHKSIDINNFNNTIKEFEECRDLASNALSKFYFEEEDENEESE